MPNHTKLKKAAAKAGKLQKKLDVIHDAMFKDHLEHEEALTGLPQVARDRFIQSGSMRSMAQIVLTYLTYRIEYLSLPKSSRKDDEAQVETRKMNKKLLKKTGLSKADFRKYSRYKIDVLLPLAQDLVKETMKNWKEYQEYSS